MRQNADDLNPIFPCICGHPITAHGDYTDTEIRYEWDADHNEEVLVESPYPRAVCYECGPADCYFIEMSNLEYLEWKSDDNNKCKQR